ncbi:MAG: hypothetical protein HUU35_12035 [Armatimonadetes bacterium]|nr:hypothetical protein [Armatimonadota bacterium]
MPRGDAAGRLTSLDYGLGTASWDYLANGPLAKLTTDQETGLTALAYRYYAPGMGRFSNRDPVGTRGGIGLHVQEADPVGMWDPDGRQERGHLWGYEPRPDLPIERGVLVYQHIMYAFAVYVGHDGEVTCTVPVMT